MAEPQSPSRSVATQPALTQVSEAARLMLAEGQSEQALEYVLSALAAVLSKTRELELLVARLRRVGRSSERIDPGQLGLLFEEMLAQLGPEQERPDPEAEARRDAELEAEIERAREARREREPVERPARPTWRTEDTEGVERVIHTVEVPPEAHICDRCGGEKTKIGEDTSRVLEYVPGHFVEHEYHLDKWACGTCKVGVTTAPTPDRVLSRSAADASVLAHVVVSKYVDHMPLHRLSRSYERSGVRIPVSTLSDWVAGVAERVEPLVERVASRILREAYVVGTDATGLPVLDPSSPAHIQRGTVWAYVGDDTDVVFRYAPTGEGASGPWDFLAGRTGYIHADAANVFDRLFNGEVASATEVGCWAHARRKFVALQDTDYRVAYPLRLIGRLYRIETLADLQDLSPDERAQLRQERSQPVLGDLQAWIVRTLALEPPSSALAKACAYVLNHWTALTRFLSDGLLQLDNNGVERQLRGIALGRKNFLFAGSHEAAHRTTTLYSLLSTAAQHGLRPLPYLTDILRRLAAGWPARRLDDLLPGRWKPDGPAP